MSALAIPVNIQSHAAALAENLSRGDRVHIGVCGNHVTENAVFIQFVSGEQGIVVSVNGVPTKLLWGDIIELWLLDEKPNNYHSDVPEVAEKLRQLKSAILSCVEQDNSAGVLYLLDQIIQAKKAENLFREARKIVASIQF